MGGQVEATGPDLTSDGVAANDVREGEIVTGQANGEPVRSMLGNGAPFRAIPFFWSTHYDLTINYVGHAESYDSVEVSGSVRDRDCAIAYRRRGKTLAVATINRDLVSLRAEAALERGEEPALA